MKRRILVAIVCVAAVSVVLFGTPLAVVMTRVYRQERVIELQRLAARSQTELAEDLAKHQKVLDPVGLSRRTQLAFYDAAGTRLIGTGPRQLHIGPLAKPAAKAERKGARPVVDALHNRVGDADLHGMVVTAIPVTHGDVVVGALRAAEPRSLYLGRVYRTWLAMVALVFMILMVAAGIARVLARRLVQPVDALSETASRLGEGDFTVRSAPTGVAEFDAVGNVLDATAARLGELVTRERAFSSDASHQLRTPLAGLRLRIEQSLPNPRDHQRALEDALELVDGLAVTVEQLLALARDLPVERTTLDVAALLEEAAARLRPQLWEQRRGMVIAIDRNLPAVRVSTAAVREILDVLGSNAAQHGGGVVTLRARDTGGGVALEVSDEGRGVEGDIERIFQRRSRSSGGHGIGLVLARSLAEAEGGRLVLKRSGDHPTFALLLLATDEAPDDERAASAA